jgi:hypothetical protein
MAKAMKPDVEETPRYVQQNNEEESVEVDLKQ